MSEVSLELPSPKLAATLFGTHDRHLRRVRGALGVRVVYRDGRLYIEGDEPQVADALEVFRQLRTISEQKGALEPDEVERALNEVRREHAEETETFDLLHKTRPFRARTPGQNRYVQAIRGHDVTFCIGPAGTGKTYIAVAMAIHALCQNAARKIVLVRPAVEAGEKLGFLPGDIHAKVNPYQRPLLDALNDMMDYEQVRRYLDNDVIEIAPLAYMRGRTLSESFIILDEGQNTTVPQMKMFLTRMGMNSKIVVSGDVTQIDLPAPTRSGLKDAVHRLRGVSGIAVVHLSERDIVRHRLVQEIVRAYEGTEATPARKD